MSRALSLLLALVTSWSALAHAQATGAEADAVEPDPYATIVDPYDAPPPVSPLSGDEPPEHDPAHAWDPFRGIGDPARGFPVSEHRVALVVDPTVLTITSRWAPIGWDLFDIRQVFSLHLPGAQWDGVGLSSHGGWGIGTGALWHSPADRTRVEVGVRYFAPTAELDTRGSLDAVGRAMPEQVAAWAASDLGALELYLTIQLRYVDPSTVTVGGELQIAGGTGSVTSSIGALAGSVGHMSLRFFVGYWRIRAFAEGGLSYASVWPEEIAIPTWVRAGLELALPGGVVIDGTYRHSWAQLKENDSSALGIGVVLRI